jgi:hypothetical protein
MHKDDIENIRVAVLENLPIELYIVLKIEKIVQSGGEAKYVIAEGRGSERRYLPETLSALLEKRFKS